MLKLEKYKDYIITNIAQNKPISVIAKELNEYPQAVRNVIKKYLPDKKFTYNQGDIFYFNKIDCDTKAYFIGFIAADGSLVKRKSDNSIALSITINKKDKLILDTLKNCIGCENPVSFLKSNDLVRFVIQNKQISDDLQTYGIEPNKSLTMPSIIHKIPKEYRKAFLRGYFDGDGSVFKNSKNKYYITIRGTLEFLQSYIEEFNLNSYSLKQYDYEKIGKLTTGSKDSIKKFITMYENSEVHLQRKHEIFLNFMEKHYQDQTISSP